MIISGSVYVIINNRELIQLKIFPLKVQDGFVVISLVPYHGKLEKRNKLSLVVSDWTKVYFRYNCDKKCWEYDRTENGGI